MTNDLIKVTDYDLIPFLNSHNTGKIICQIKEKKTEVINERGKQ